MFFFCNQTALRAEKKYIRYIKGGIVNKSASCVVVIVHLFISISIHPASLPSTQRPIDQSLRQSNCPSRPSIRSSTRNAF